MPFHIVVKKDATIPDTLKLINKAVNVYYRSPFVTRLTQQLNPTGSKYDFVKRVFDFVAQNVRYKLDRVGDEEVWSPEKTVREGVGDCKKMTVLIASILKNAGIEPVLKHVHYSGESHTHIYVIVPFPDLKNYLTVDPVNHKQWNTEVNHAKASLNFLNGKKMDLHMMGKAPESKFKVSWNAVNESLSGIEDDLSAITGIGCAINGTKEEVLAEAMYGDEGILGLNDDEIIYGIGMGRRKKRSKAERKEKRKAFKQKAFRVFKTANLAPIRASFLTLVRFNVFKLANRMAKVWIHDPKPLTDMWLQFGGDPKRLKNTIKQGAWKSIREKMNGIGFADNPPSVVEMEAMEVQGISGTSGGIGLELQGIGVAPAVLAAAIAAATPIILATIKIVGKSKDDQDSNASTEEMAEAVNEGAQNYAQAVEGIGYMNDADDIVSGNDYDYIDGMGKKRKKNKQARKTKRQAKKAYKKEKRAIKRANKKGGGGSAELQEVSEEVLETAQQKLPITDSDVKALSTLANYGLSKINKGQVTSADINNLSPDETGTKDQPLAPVKRDSDDISPSPLPQKGGAQASSFGLSAINSISDLLHWFRGSMLFLFAMSLAGIAVFNVVADLIVLLSLAWFTRSHIYNLIKKQFSWRKIGKQ